MPVPVPWLAIFDFVPFFGGNMLKTLLKRLKIYLCSLLPGRGVYYIGGSDTLPPPLTPEE